jgi:hypothetical protein
MITHDLYCLKVSNNRPLCNTFTPEAPVFQTRLFVVGMKGYIYSYIVKEFQISVRLNACNDTAFHVLL